MLQNGFSIAAVRQPAANRPEFAEPVGDVNCSSSSTINSNSRMRLAKGFFLPFLAAEWLHYRRRPPTGGHRPAMGPLFAKPLGSSITHYKYLPMTLPHCHITTQPHYQTSTEPHCHSTSLSHCHSAILPLCHSAITLHHHTVTL